MGAVFGGGKFKAYNWRQGISEVQKEDARLYGYEYSGASNCCDFMYDGDKSKLTKKQLEEYRKNQMDILGGGMGVVIQTGAVSYDIWTTEYKEMQFEAKTRKSYFQGRDFVGHYDPKCTAVLVDSADKIVSAGTVTEMKNLAHTILRKQNYSNRFYIISKNSKCYRCRGICKTVAKTTRKTTDSVLVLPLNEYMYMGWFKE